MAAVTLVIGCLLFLLSSSCIALGYRGTIQMASPAPSFLTLPNGEKIAYHRHSATSDFISSNGSTKSPVGVVFCCGFRSSMNGNKALQLEQFCRERSMGFTRFDYRGHGESQGNFDSLGLSDWISDARTVVKESCRDQGGPQLLVGSSMGGWIALRLALEQPDTVAGILGIAAALDFTVDIWNGMTAQQQKELQRNGRVLLPSEYSDQPYPISRHLLEDANQYLILAKRGVAVNALGTVQSTTSRNDAVAIQVQCPIRLVHGMNDVDVSWEKSLQLVDAIASEDVQFTLIKSGDHRLSTTEDLDTICHLLEELVKVTRQPKPSGDPRHNSSSNNSS